MLAKFRLCRRSSLQPCPRHWERQICMGPTPDAGMLGMSEGDLHNFRELECDPWRGIRKSTEGSDAEVIEPMLFLVN